SPPAGCGRCSRPGWRKKSSSAACSRRSCRWPPARTWRPSPGPRCCSAWRTRPGCGCAAGTSWRARRRRARPGRSPIPSPWWRRRASPSACCGRARARFGWWCSCTAASTSSRSWPLSSAPGPAPENSRAGRGAYPARMNYRHAFHAGNHADVLKHVVLLALCDALTAKPAPLFALDTHAGRGLYRLAGASAQRTGEADGGIARLLAEGPRDPLVRRYLDAVAACRRAHGADAYPGSPWLLAHALRPGDRIVCCETQPEEAGALAAALAGDRRLRVHEGDGYAAMRAFLPPRDGAARLGRGLVLVDP